MHLHDQGFVSFFSFFSLLAVYVQKYSGNNMSHTRKYCKGITPTNVIVIWVQEPITIPAFATKNANGEKQ